MRPELLDRLRCPACRDDRARLSLAPGAAEGTVGPHREFRSGSLLCSACRLSLPLAEGVPDLLHQPSEAIRSELAGTDRSFGEATPEAIAAMLRQPGIDDPSHAAHWLSVRGNLAQLLSMVGAEPDRPGTLVLDLGCGSAYSTAALADLRPEVVGLDISVHATAGLGAAGHRLAAGAPYFDRVRADMENLPFRTGTAGLVTALASLHHADDLTATLREIHRVLAPGGVLLVAGEPVVGLLKNRSHGEHEIEEMGWNEHAYSRTGYLRALWAAGFAAEVRFPTMIESRLEQANWGEGLANRLLGPLAAFLWKLPGIARLARTAGFPLAQHLFGLPFMARAVRCT